MTQLVRNLVSSLERNRRLNILLVIGYLIFIFVMHDAMVGLSLRITNSLTLPRYDLIIAAIMMAAVSLIIFLFIKNLRSISHAADIKIFFMTMLIGLTVIHTQMNFVMNIEVIHMLQFGIIALLIFPLTRSFGATLYYTVMLGLLDELFQYAVLYPDKNDYLDFNDVVLDQLGAGMMLVYLYSCGIGSHHSGRKWYKSPVLISAGVMVVSVALLLHFSLISVYYSAGSVNPLLILSEAPGPEEFWRQAPNLNKVFHVMSPLEGVIIIAVICGLFYLLDYLEKKIAAAVNSPDFKSEHALRIATDGDEPRAKSASASRALRLVR